MNCGHHGIWGKGNGTRPQNMYDTSVKVPCLVAQPGRIAPGVSDALLSGYDVFPTLLDYLGIADVDRAAAPGRELPRAARGRPRRRQRRAWWSTTSTARCGWCARASGSTCTAIPTGRTSSTTSRRDPGERRNLVDDAAHRAIVAMLRARARRRGSRSYVDPARGRRAQARHRLRAARPHACGRRRPGRVSGRSDRAARPSPKQFRA